MKLYDAYGREVATEALREEQAAPTMAGVRNIYSVMHPSAGLTPDKVVAIQREAEMGDPYLYLELAEEMEEKDLHYLAVISTRKQAIAGAELIVTPASEAAVDRRAADLVRAVIAGGALDLENALYDILDAVGKGFSATEIVWDTSGREWIPRRLIWRDPRFFMFDWISGNELLVRTVRDEGSIAPVDGVAVTPARLSGATHYRSRWYAGAEDDARIGIQPLTAPLAPFKFIVHVAKAKSGLPVRGGIARAAGWAYLFKNYVLKDWVTFAEIFGQPLRLGKYSPGATEADKQALLSAVTNIGTDAAAIIPESMLIEFVEARQAGGARALSAVLRVPGPAGEQGRAGANLDHRDAARGRRLARGRAGARRGPPRHHGVRCAPAGRHAHARPGAPDYRSQSGASEALSANRVGPKLR